MRGCHCGGERKAVAGQPEFPLTIPMRQRWIFFPGGLPLQGGAVHGARVRLRAKQVGRADRHSGHGGLDDRQLYPQE